MEGLHPLRICSARSGVMRNALSRVTPFTVEYVAGPRAALLSGRNGCLRHVLQERWSRSGGTHARPQLRVCWRDFLTRSMEPGFLIGGVPQNFGVRPAWRDAIFLLWRRTSTNSAFFDKRSKFVHYRPRHSVLNNL